MSLAFISVGNLNRRCVVLACLWLAPFTQAEAPPVTVVGAYSNVVVTDEHAQGYAIQLWRQGDLYFGFFQRAAGLAGDTPSGLLEDLRVDPQDHTIAFKAKLSVGSESMNGETWVPSRDLYQFSGTLFLDQISGSLVHLNGNHPESRGTAEEIKLYRSKKEEADLMLQTTSYQEWTESARKILRARGPKW